MLPPDNQPPASSPAFGEGGFEPYLRAIRGHPALVAAVMLAALAGAGLWLLVRSPEYRAASDVLVSPVPYDDNSYVGLPVLRDTPRDPTRVIQTGAAMLDSPAAAAVTARRLGDGWSARRVRAAVSVEPRGQSNVLAVEARASRARLSARIANTFSRAALEQRSVELRREATELLARLKTKRGPPVRQFDLLRAVSVGIDPTFSLLHPATTPRSPVASAPWRIFLLALFAGALLACAAALASDALGRRFGTEDEAGEPPRLRSRISAPRS